ncbi:MAG: hypothetical protein NUV74_12790 [Candidatus Brocadiaceae bacterium]|nr:hypothetical protein [Candidatus Brocadiaceae bacterium]
MDKLKAMAEALGTGVKNQWDKGRPFREMMGAALTGNFGDVGNIAKDYAATVTPQGLDEGIMNAGMGFAPMGMAGILKPKTSAGLFVTEGLSNRGRDLIQSEAESLAQRFRDEGFDAIVDHSGSAAGPSSYLRISDPQTGRFINPQIRLSGHSKGANESQGVWNVAHPDDYEKVLQVARDMRAKGPSAMMKKSLESKK